MNDNYWKDAYKNTWDESAKRERRLKYFIENRLGIKCLESGLGAGSTQYISGSAIKNGYQKGDADFYLEGTNIFIEVTGPLSKAVQPSSPLWFRPDKLRNAIKNNTHDVFLVHHCISADLWRVIHIDQGFIKRFEDNEFKVRDVFIRGRKEQYIEIEATDKCVHGFAFLVDYLVAVQKNID